MHLVKGAASRRHGDPRNIRPHSITRSARASKVGGMLRPSFLGPQIDHELDCGRLLDGQFRGLGALQNARHEIRRAAVGLTRASGRKSVARRSLPSRPSRKQPEGAFHREIDYRVSVLDDEPSDKARSACGDAAPISPSARSSSERLGVENKEISISRRSAAGASSDRSRSSPGCSGLQLPRCGASRARSHARTRDACR